MDSYTLVEIPAKQGQKNSNTDTDSEYMQIAETDASGNISIPSHIENSNTLSQAFQAEFDITLSSVTYVKKNIKSCRMKWYMCFLIFSSFGASLVLLGVYFDIWVRLSVTTILNYFLEPLTREFRNTYRIKKSVPSVIPKPEPVFIPWLIGLELSLTLQPFILKEKDIYHEINKTNESVVLTLKIEDKEKLRLYIDPFKSSKAGFTAQFKNVNAPRIILSHFVNDLVKTKASDHYLQELLFNLIISKTNISKQAVPVKSLQDIVKDLNVLKNFADHIPNKHDQEIVNKLISFIIENDAMNKSLVYDRGNLSIEMYSPQIQAYVNDIGAYFDMPSSYTIPGTNFTYGHARNSSWHGIQTWRYIKPKQIPESVLGYIHEKLQKIPLSVSKPNSDPTKNITEIITDPSVQFSTGDPSISFDSNHHDHLSISLEVHSTLNIPVSATAYVQVSVIVPDTDLYGNLKGKTVPYMMMQLSLSQLPGWIMAFFQVFSYFRLGFIVILVSSGVALVVMTVIFTAIASADVGPVEGEDECDFDSAEDIAKKEVNRFLCIFVTKCTCKLQTVVNEDLNVTIS